MNNRAATKIEYGDFQTPAVLAQQICQKLIALGVFPDLIIEPTCGVGTFIKAALQTFPTIEKIIGLEINSNYLQSLAEQKIAWEHAEKIELIEGNFFEFDWKKVLDIQGSPLILGNFPWVTNAQQAVIQGKNLPPKTNFQHHLGMDALTGKSNFDISEWMLLQIARGLQNRHGYLAMLCKTSVARKFLAHLRLERIGIRQSMLYQIDAKLHFNACVDACLLFCEFDPLSHDYDYLVYQSIESEQGQWVGYRNGRAVRDIEKFEQLSQYDGHSKLCWRSGIKHDCSNVLELRQKDDNYFNKLGELVDIEPYYLYPLLKGSDIANDRITHTERYLLTTQTNVGEDTDSIQKNAPKTWQYLEIHASYFNARKSRIYLNHPKFSIFGVGNYSFAPYKIAICGLYKKLAFRLIQPIEQKAVVFDDTVYFLSFDDETEARSMFKILTSQDVLDFYATLIFWDDKRPIKSNILNRLVLYRGN